MTYIDPYDQKVEQNFEDLQVDEFVSRVSLNTYRAIRNVYTNAFTPTEILPRPKSHEDKLWKMIEPVADLHKLRREDMSLIINGRDISNWELSMIKDLNDEISHTEKSIAIIDYDVYTTELYKIIQQIRNRITKIYKYAVINKQLYED